MRIVYFSLLFFSIALHAWSDAEVSSVTIQESQSRYSSTLAAPSVDKAWVESHYDKQEVMIPMRDGTRLFTAIYTPKQSDGKSPMLFKRTPYECAYGASWESALWRGWHKYAEDNYIFVFQDVRGKGKSEGVYVNIRPLASFIHGGKSFDEATDTYDTCDWLLAHVANHNGNIALIGSSYCGFYAIQGALCGHKAIKAAVPQAPVFNWFRGDDFHHNGVFFVRDAFNFTNKHCRVREGIGREPKAPDFMDTDDYSFFLRHTIKDLSAKFRGEVPFWTEMCEHPDEDEWWLARDYTRFLTNVKPAVMVVGGLWDAEDNYGACQLYRSLAIQNPDMPLFFTLGPWSHGGWNNTDKNALGAYVFGEQNQSAYYQEKIEYPFLNRYLRNTGVALPESERVKVFYTGENKWHAFSKWPEGEDSQVFYLHPNGMLSETPPTGMSSSSSYISDPEHPVPYIEGTWYKRPAEYMTGDQRFAGRRSDVLSFTTQPLEEDVTLSGEVEALLRVSISTADADFVVKLIDVYPDDYSRRHPGEPNTLNGYQLPVRMDIMRGRYREGFARGVPFVPDVIATVPVRMQAIAHTFRKGHSIALQIQSSWFPLADMNPQQFVDIYHCDKADFVKSNITVYHQKDQMSQIIINPK